MSSPTASPAQSSDTKTQPSGFLRILRNYRFPLFILTGVVVGAVIGLVFGERATVIKPFGTLFINMMFTLVVPLVFFSVSSAVAGMSSAARLGKIMGSMLGVFAVTGIIASIVMVAALRIFNATDGVQVEMQEPENVEEVGSIGDQLVQTVVVDDFSKLMSA
ncbi:MAG TPA: dicarboxylate/amino acid:cation symporter, partial [Brevibacterium linens]|nr:dicarboxylate/amino acid:cation symporter [Brevibacterium linens]